MDMGLEPGSRFVTTLGFPAGTLEEGILPGPEDFFCDFGDLAIFDPDGNMVFQGQVPEPSGAILLCCGLIGLFRRRRK